MGTEWREMTKYHAGKGRRSEKRTKLSIRVLKEEMDFPKKIGKVFQMEAQSVQKQRGEVERVGQALMEDKAHVLYTCAPAPTHWLVSLKSTITHLSRPFTLPRNHTSLPQCHLLSNPPKPLFHASCPFSSLLQYFLPSLQSQ